MPHRWFTFRRHETVPQPLGTDVRFYVNAAGELVKKLADGRETTVGAADDIAAAIAAHEAASDAHPGYLTATEGNAAYSASGHAHSGVYLEPDS